MFLKLKNFKHKSHQRKKYGDPKASLQNIKTLIGSCSLIGYTHTHTQTSTYLSISIPISI